MILCVTGPMAAGKNLASDILEEEGFDCIDADKAVHHILPDCTGEIFDTFREDAAREGIELKASDGSLDRRALGKLIFPHPELLRKQEGIVYPRLALYIEELIKNSENSGKSTVINAAVMNKTPELLSKCKAVIFIDAPILLRFFRAKKRDGMKTRQILSRFHSQKNLLKEYISSGIPVIRIMNAGSRGDLKKKLEKTLSSPLFQ